MERVSVWIYYYTDENPHLVKAIIGNIVWEMPVRGTTLQKTKTMMRQVFHNPIFTAIEILKDEVKDGQETSVQTGGKAGTNLLDLANGNPAGQGGRSDDVQNSESAGYETRNDSAKDHK